MARKMSLKWCPECGRSFRARKSLAKHLTGYTRKYDGKEILPCIGDADLSRRIAMFDKQIRLQRAAS